MYLFLFIILIYFLMGNIFNNDQDTNHILLLGPEGSGKTKFLYENLLENSIWFN